MKCLIICESMHLGNTQLVARAMAEVLGAAVRRPGEVNLEGYDLIGFGSGIYNKRHHQNLFSMLDGVRGGTKAFIFSTASLCYLTMHEPLRERLEEKGFEVVDEFMCKGWMYSGFMRFFGGINKNHPTKADLEAARKFAQNLL
ncbi:MAG: flavodoxin family protein [Nanobdellota archaeon]